MIGTKYSIYFLQYIPKKPTKWGIKAFVNAESSTGYVLKFEMYYVGDSGSDNTIVMRLMDQYLDKGHKLFTDNFYTSPLLYRALLDRGTYACGTVRQKLKTFPSQIRVNVKKEKEHPEPTLV